MPSDPPAGAGRSITVLGAGIVGTCCAFALQREGFAVTLIDRDRPGAGTSSGNAGLIQTGTPLPMATPGLWKAIPGMLLDSQSPLAVRWRYLPQLLGWMLRFLRQSGAARFDRNSKAMMALLDQVAGSYRELLKAAVADDLVRYRGLMFVYKGAKEADAAAWEMALFRRQGVQVDTLNEDELRQMEPALSRDYTHGYYLPDGFFTVDPLALTERLAAAFEEAGGTIRRAEVSDIEMDADGPTALQAGAERIPVERLVLAAGVFSKPFARRLGLRPPLESARGYHLMLPTETVRLNGPVLDGKRHFAVTPMAGGIRLAGMLELASVDAKPNYARARMLLPLAKDMLPDLHGAKAEPWLGHRPALPDSLPIIEQSQRFPNCFFAFGHGQLGLTMGAITGLLIADLAAGRAPRVDLTPYRSDRF